MTTQAKINSQSSNRVAAWLAWSLRLLTMAVAALAIYLLALNGSTSDVDVFGFRGFQAYVGMMWASVGFFITARRPRNAVGWFICASGLGSLIQAFAEEYTIYALFTRPGSLPMGTITAWLPDWLWIPSVGLIAYVFLLFPDGHYVSPRWPVVSWFGAVSIAIAVSTNAFMPGQLNYFSSVTNPVSIAYLAKWPGLRVVVLLPLLLFEALAVLSIVLRYRRTRGEARQQLKWFTYAAVLVLLGALSGNLDGIVPDLALATGVAALPIAIGIAILRYRLWDIDLVIRRTLSYAALTGMLALVYFGSVVVLQNLFVGLTGQRSQVVIVVSTLAIAALFNPLRIRTQEFIDRGFYRAKYDAEQTLALFAATARDEVDMERLTGALLGVVEETMQPEQVSLWLKPTAGRQRLTAEQFQRRSIVSDQRPFRNDV